MEDNIIEAVLDEIEASNPHEIPEWRSIWNDGAKKARRIIFKYLAAYNKEQNAAVSDTTEIS